MLFYEYDFKIKFEGFHLIKTNTIEDEEYVLSLLSLPPQLFLSLLLQFEP
ncbi:hypothetical protein CsSME_00013469 [Camellia sinensis var. sinensis]